MSKKKLSSLEKLCEEYVGTKSTQTDEVSCLIKLYKDLSIDNRRRIKDLIAMMIEQESDSKKSNSTYH